MWQSVFKHNTMKQLYTLLILSGVAMYSNAQQIQGDFDAEWGKCIPWDSKNNTKDKGTEPQGWHISNVILLSEVGTQVTGKDGAGSAVQLKNVNFWGQKVPAYLTLGTPWATAEGAKANNADGGTFGGLSFKFHPDAISYDYIRDNSKGKDENATVVAYLWKGTWTQDSVPGNTAVTGKATVTTMTNRDRNILGMATAQGKKVTNSDDAMLLATLNDTIKGNTNGQWTSRTAEFHYSGDAAEVENINIIFSATDYFGDRTKIVGGNSLTVDNVRLVYYHALSALTATDDNGEEVELNFQPDVYNYTVNSVYDEYWTEVNYTKKGYGATVEAGYDDATGQYTICVKGEDYDKETNPDAITTYTIQYQKAAPTLSSLVVAGHDFIKLGDTETNFTATGHFYADELSLATTDSTATTESNYDEATGVLTIVVNQPNCPTNTYTVTFEGKSKQPIYQIPNADFETWTDDATALSATWNSFSTACGMWASFASASPAPFRVEGVEGYGVAITSKDLWVAYANGNLTTGKINMGDMNPAAAANYNFTDRTDSTANLPMAGMPDAFEVYARFKPGKAKVADTALNGRVQLIIHSDVAYRDPELPELTDSKIASAAVIIPETDDWSKFVGEFTYNTDEMPTKAYLLASATTNPVPGASKDDTLALDNLHLIYYHELSDLTINGKTIEGFDAKTTEYTVVGKLNDLMTQVGYTKKGIGAHVNMAFDYENSEITLQVVGNDFAVNPESVTYYTIHVKDAATGIEQIDADALSGHKVYTLGGQRVSGRPVKGFYIVDGKKTYVK